MSSIKDEVNTLLNNANRELVAEVKKAANLYRSIGPSINQKKATKILRKVDALINELACIKMQ